MRINHFIAACGIIVGASAVLFLATLVIGLNSTATLAATNSSCNNPLPVEYTVQKEADAPKDLASFLGHWRGQWNGSLCSSLIILSVNKDGNAQVIYSWAGGTGFKGGYDGFEAKIKEGVLAFGQRAKFKFSLTEKGNMKGARYVSSGTASVIMTKVPAR